MDTNIKSELVSDSRIEDEIDPKILYNKLYKIILIGDTNVGKTSIISKYLTGVFPDSSSAIPTIAAEFATKNNSNKRRRIYKSTNMGYSWPRKI